MNINSKNLIQIHLAVFLFGLSGLFGKVLSLSPMIIVLGRVFFSSIFLFIIMTYLKKDIKLMKREHYFYLMAMGMVLAVHWSSFFKSIQMSTVAIGLLTFLGVILVIPKFQLSNDITQGVLWGILSGFTYAVLSVLNRKYVKEYSSLVIAFYEQASAAVILAPYLFFQRPIFQGKDILLLILLGIIFTGISHSLFISGLRGIKAQTAGIISSLEPVYAIIFAALLLKEIPTLREVLGGVIILSTVFYSTIKSN